MTSFTADEKQVLSQLVQKELEYVQEQEKRGNQPPQVIAAEHKYDLMLQELLKKLK